MTDEPPNVVVALLDTARADRFSCYGNDRETTPFVDSLAAEGVRYDEAYSTSIWSFPAYTSLFTGEYPSVHGAHAWSDRPENTLVDALDEEYRTLSVSPHVMVEEFGLVQPFDRYEEVPVAHKALPFGPDPVINELRSGAGLDVRAFLETWLDHRTLRTVPNAANQLLKKAVLYRLGWWHDSGAANVVEGAKSVVADTDDPFFLFTNFVESHKPMYLPREWAFEYTDASVADVNRVNTEVDFFDATFGDTEISEADRQLYFDLHDATLRYQDAKLRELYEFLESQGEAENTVFVVLSDHGDLYGERGVWGHRAHVHRNLCRVPLVVRYPWGEPAVETGPVSIRELYDLFVDVTAGERATLATDRDVFVEFAGEDPGELASNGVPEKPWVYYHVSHVADGWKLNWRADGDVELYDVEADPGEEADVAEDHPDRVEAMQETVEAELGHPRELHGQFGDETDVESLDDEVTAHLKAMGYLKEDN